MPTWVTALLITFSLAVLGGVFNAALEIGQVNDKLDRNCRILVQLDQDIRFHATVRPHQQNLQPFPEVSC